VIYFCWKCFILETKTILASETLRSKHLVRILHHKETEPKTKKSPKQKKLHVEISQRTFIFKVSLPKKGFAINVLE